MAYNADNLQISINHEKGIRRRWFYVSTDAKAVVLGASYISNAVAVGMKSGDIVDVVDTTNGLGYVGYATVGATAATLAALPAFT